MLSVRFVRSHHLRALQYFFASSYLTFVGNCCVGTMLFWVNLVVLACVIMYIVAVAALGIVLPTQTFAAVIVPAVWTAVSNVVGLFTCRHSKALVAYVDAKRMLRQLLAFSAGSLAKVLVLEFRCLETLNIGNDLLLRRYIVLTGLAFLAMLIAGIWLFVSVPALQEEMANLTSDDLSQVVSRRRFRIAVLTPSSLDFL